MERQRDGAERRTVERNPGIAPHDERPPRIAPFRVKNAIWLHAGYEVPVPLFTAGAAGCTAAILAAVCMWPSQRFSFGAEIPN